MKKFKKGLARLGIVGILAGGLIFMIGALSVSG